MVWGTRPCGPMERSTIHARCSRPTRLCPLEHRTSAQMLAFFRSMSKSKVISVLVGLPLLAGLLTIGNVRGGLTDLFTPKDAVIQAGQRNYTTDDFKREVDG